MTLRKKAEISKRSSVENSNAFNSKFEIGGETNINLTYSKGFNRKKILCFKNIVIVFMRESNVLNFANAKTT